MTLLNFLQTDFLAAFHSYSSYSIIVYSSIFVFNHKYEKNNDLINLFVKFLIYLFIQLFIYLRLP